MTGLKRFHSAQALATFLLRSSDDQTVLIGPIVHDTESDDYCIVATGHKGEVQVDRVDLDDERDYRNIITAMIGQKPLVVLVMDDELIMAQLGETIWPTAKMRGIREAIERERQPMQ